MSTENATDVSQSVSEAIAGVAPGSHLALAPVAPNGQVAVTPLPTNREFNLLQKIASQLGSASGALPGGMRGPQALAVMLAGRELGMGPMESLRNIHLIEGSLSVSPNCLKGRAERAGWTIDLLESDEVRCTIRATRGETSTTMTWTIDDAKRAQLVERKGWKKYPRQYLRARVLGELLEYLDPSLLSGGYVIGELEDRDEALIDVEFSGSDAGGGGGGGNGNGPAFAGWGGKPATTATEAGTTATATLVENAVEGGPPGNGGVDHGGGDRGTVIQVQVTPVVATTLPPVADVTPPVMATPEQIAQAQQYIKAGVLTVEQWKQAVSLFGVKSIKELRTETADKLLERVARWSMRQGSPPWEPEATAVEGGAATDPKSEAGAAESATITAGAAAG